MSAFHPKLTFRLRPIADIRGRLLGSNDARYTVPSMNRLVLLRLTWGLLALPLALIALVAILAMWPAVFTNAPLNLLAIAYVLLLPLLPVFWSGKRPRIVIGLALATTVVQWCLFAILNRWF